MFGAAKLQRRFYFVSSYCVFMLPYMDQTHEIETTSPCDALMQGQFNVTLTEATARAIAIVRESGIAIAHVFMVFDGDDRGYVVDKIQVSPDRQGMGPIIKEGMGQCRSDVAEWIHLYSNYTVDFEPNLESLLTCTGVGWYMEIADHLDFSDAGNRYIAMAMNTKSGEIEFIRRDTAASVAFLKMSPAIGLRGLSATVASGTSYLN